MTVPNATADVHISASPQRVWEALTQPEEIKAYFFGAEVDTSWEPGSPITWRGEYDGKSYEDKGEVLDVEPGKRLAVTHFSPLTGKADVPENYHRVQWELQGEGDHTDVVVEQTLAEGETPEQAEENWTNVLRQLKEYVERG